MEKINEEIKNHELELSKEDWKYSAIAKLLHRFIELFNTEFFGERLPVPYLCIEKVHGRSAMGTYSPGRNGVGARFEITINPVYFNKGLQETLSTLAHELTHVYEHIEKGSCGSGNYHTVTFQNKAEEIGIPVNAKGEQLGMVDPFVAFLKRHGIDDATEVPVKRSQLPQKGKTKMLLWKCKCPVRVRCAVDLDAMCNCCGQQFKLVKSKRNNGT